MLAIYRVYADHKLDNIEVLKACAAVLARVGRPYTLT